MSRLAIKGSAMISPIGTRMEDIRGRIERGETGLCRLDRFASGRDMLCGEIRDFDLTEFVTDGRFRRAAPISQFALASISAALGKTDTMESGINTAMIMAIKHGALGYTQSFHRDLISAGPGAVSPIHFSDSVLNAPAGNASICFGFKGPVHTVLGGPEAVIKSIRIACRMLETGHADRAIVVSAEELNELSSYCYTRLGYPSVSEGAGTLIIEREKPDEQTADCFIAGAASECNPADPKSALRNSLSVCMEQAGLQVPEIDLVMACMKEPDDCILEGIPTADLTPFTGYAFATSMLWSTVLSASAIGTGSAPQSIVRTGKVNAKLRNIMVCTADNRGNAAAMILSRID